MKTITTLTLIIFSQVCFSQADKNKGKIQFDAFGKGEIMDFEFNLKQAVKFYRSQDSLRGIFIQKVLFRNGVDINRISNHPDSLIVKPAGIEYILKPIKK